MRITPGLIILVGPPASGKTTFVREMIAAGRLAPEAVVSTDTIRAELYGDDPVGFDSDLADPLVFAERDRRIGTRLAAGHYAVAESTNVTVQARRRLIAIAEEFGAPVTVLRFVQDTADLLAQHAERQQGPTTTSDVLASASLMRDAEPDRLLAEGAAAVFDVPGRGQDCSAAEAARRFTIG